MFVISFVKQTKPISCLTHTYKCAQAADSCSFQHRAVKLIGAGAHIDRLSDWQMNGETLQSKLSSLQSRRMCSHLHPSHGTTFLLLVHQIESLTSFSFIEQHGKLRTSHWQWQPFWLAHKKVERFLKFFSTQLLCKCKWRSTALDSDSSDSVFTQQTVSVRISAPGQLAVHSVHVVCIHLCLPVHILKQWEAALAASRCVCVLPACHRHTDVLVQD